MGVTLTDVLLFGKAQLADVDKATLVIYRRNILRWSALGGYLDIIVKGVAPLSLPDAIADSLSYVKAFGGTEQRNIPAEYVENQFVYMLNGSYLGVKDQSITSDYKIEFDFATTNLSTSLANYFGARASGVAAGGGFRVTKLANNGVAMYGFDTTDAYESGANIMAANTRYKYVYENGTCTLSSGGTDVLTHTYTVNDTSTITAFGINAYTSNGTSFSASGLGIYFYGLKIWNAQGELIADYVPATLLNPLTVGIYDRVSGTHLLPTAGTWSAGPALQAPTPDRPINIVCNNGTLKARHQSGLPLGYTLLDSVVFDSTQNIDTGFTPDNNTRIESKCYRTGSVCWVYGAGAYNPRVTLYNSDTGTSRWGNQYRNNFGFAANTEYTVIQDKNGLNINGVDNPWNSGTAGDFTCDVSLTIGNSNGATGTRYFAGNLYYLKIYDNGVLVRDFVPCQNASNVVGLYDTVNGVFYTDTGLVAGTPVSDPVEVYADGTVETLWMHSKNLFDENWNKNTGVSTQTATWGQVVTANGFSTSGLIPVKAGGQYTISYSASVGVLLIFYYNPDGTMQQDFIQQTGITQKTFTVPAGATSVRLQIQRSGTTIDGIDSQLEVGSTATTYEPYYNGGTATAEMLLKVGDYQDVQEILAGDVTRKVGVKVLNGTENWQLNNNRFRVQGLVPISESNVMACSHFAYTGNLTTDNTIYRAVDSSWLQIRYDTANNDVTTFTNFLAAQYANGTPVILVYPLATETTESVAGQTLQVQAGDNTLEITQASMNNLELEAKYQASVLLTIQEVQDANLDPNVEVTIS